MERRARFLHAKRLDRGGYREAVEKEVMDAVRRAQKTTFSILWV